MVRKFSGALLCGFVLIGTSHAQEVFVPRQLKAKAVTETKAKPATPAQGAVTAQAAPQTRIEPAIAAHPAKIEIRRAEAVTPQTASATVHASATSPIAQMNAVTHKTEPAATHAQTTVATAPMKAAAHKPEATSTQPALAAVHPKASNAPVVPDKNKADAVSAKPAVAEARKQTTTTAQTTLSSQSVAATVRKTEALVSRSPITQTREAEVVPTIPASMETAFTKLADGFDFPVGKPDAQGYYKARGFRSHGHLGEDWDGVGGGDTDLGDPIYSIGDGIVVFARDCHMGWGNVVIVRHTFRENGMVKNVDALYGHLLAMLVHRGQTVARGQKIATMGTAHGLYDAHLHLEIRKNIEIGMSRAAFARDFNNYYDPSTFIASHRHLATSNNKYRVAMNTFTHDANIHFDKLRNYSHAHSGGGSGESAANLKKALASQSGH
jgi:murein DD-endopeptidase MepM/ murein hydrolase activator NlpD